MQKWFVKHPRLNIPVPDLEKDWNEYTKEEQEYILGEWEKIRGMIPDRIKQLERQIEQKQDQLNHEMNFGISCRLNDEISELASMINELWILYRSSERLTVKQRDC
ncbi:hypothetical protein EDD68_10428 [Melghiribacillus thermohalophilus]|uniref:Uncharacterized protein n=1 Tax=Melghiribacillus thermohalophilus TaxID=1324956 RepID=A0A4R3N8V8_9BACI|nr:hypothetical protein [Melghiribacillus thermohalophilus]TCT24961.1 hypothetical protein EDD68_10428 [Melghiribacillus thermohalophilus]